MAAQGAETGGPCKGRLNDEALLAEVSLRERELLRERGFALGLVGALAIPFFAVLDLAVAPGLAVWILAVRGTTALVDLLAAALLRRTRRDAVALGAALAIGLITAEHVVVLSVLLGGFASTYYIGVALVVFAVGLFLPLPRRWMIAYCVVVLASYVGLNGAIHGIHTAREVLEPSLLILTVCVLATVATTLERRRRAREICLRHEVERRLADSERAARLARELGEREARLARVGKISGTILHDLRQPLTVLAVVADSLEHQVGAGPDGAAMREDLQSLTRQVERMRALITEAMDVANGQQVTLVRRPIEARAFFEPLVEDLRAVARKRGVTLNVAIDTGPDDEPVLLDLDTDRVRRVFENLVRNALDAVDGHEGGRPGTVRVEASVRDGGLEARVLDDGPGLDEATLEHLFEPLVTAGKAGGVGLGLDLARTVVEAHGGRLTAIARGPLGGACFELSIPPA
jgi:signal transduction histidine kinase